MEFEEQPVLEEELRALHIQSLRILAKNLNISSGSLNQKELCDLLLPHLRIKDLSLDNLYNILGICYGDGSVSKAFDKYILLKALYDHRYNPDQRKQLEKEEEEVVMAPARSSTQNGNGRSRSRSRSSSRSRSRSPDQRRQRQRQSKNKRSPSSRGGGSSNQGLRSSNDQRSRQMERSLKIQPPPLPNQQQQPMNSLKLPPPIFNQSKQQPQKAFNSYQGEEYRQSLKNPEEKRNLRSLYPAAGERNTLKQLFVTLQGTLTKIIDQLDNNNE